jgi:hypothetical protein
VHSEHQVVVADWLLAVQRFARTAGTGKHTGPEAALALAAAAVEQLELEVAVVAALSERPGATVPMPPSSLAVVGLELVPELVVGYTRLELCRELQRPEVEEGVHMVLPVGASLSTVAANLRCCY